MTVLRTLYQKTEKHFPYFLMTQRYTQGWLYKNIFHFFSHRYPHYIDMQANNFNFNLILPLIYAIL